MQRLAERASASFSLPELKPRAVHEAEHTAVTFNSVLPLFAASTHGHGALGRTLLWKGGCHLFDGPSGAARGEKLRQAIFHFSNTPRPGEGRLEMLDFILGMDGLDLYEPVGEPGLDEPLNEPGVDEPMDNVALWQVQDFCVELLSPDGRDATPPETE